MLKIHPLERPNIVDILERLQEISLSKNVSPKQPLSSLVAPSAAPGSSGSDPAHPGMSYHRFTIVFYKEKYIFCFAFVAVVIML